MKRLILSLFVMLCIVITANAQNRTVSGTVTSQGDNLPIPGVSVQIVGASGGAITGSDGRFSISIPSGAKALKFSYIGYVSETKSITSGPVNIALAADSKGLNEVVVVGYGTQVRKDITGSVGSVKGSTISNLASSSFDKQLAGQVAGVQAANTSGILGQPAKIRIRGTNSISSSADPLYVIDGVPYLSGDLGGVTSYNPLGDINPNDIESYDVLKDGAATAIYGSRAANGVVLITTKRGKTGAAKITYDAWFALATPSKTFKLLDADQFVTITNEKFVNAGGTADAKLELNSDGSEVNTDWQKQVFRTAFQMNHSISISGATDKTNYYFSAGFADLKGTSIGNDQRKYNVRSKIEQKALNDHLTIGLNTAVNYTKNNGFNDGQGTGNLSGNIASALRDLPNVRVKNADGSYNVDYVNNILGSGANAQGIEDNYPNIAYILANNIYQSQALNLTGNAFARIKIIDGLTATSQIGINYINVEDYNYLNPLHGDGQSVNGSGDQISQPFFRYNWQNTVAYSKTFGDSKLDVVAGLEFQKTNQRSFEAYGTDLSNTYFGTNRNIISSTYVNQFIYGNSIQQAYASTFGRVNYSYLDRYLLSASIRRDKISDLPIGNQGATLPGASLGWRISKEDFFANSSALKFINDLKLRGGYAKVGNVDIGAYKYAGLYAPVTYGSSSGLGYSRLGNPDLRFETSKKLDVGLDLAMFNSRIVLNADYFKNNIDNLILDSPTPASVGVPNNSIATNVGSMYNKGWEFSITSTNITTDKFTWTTNFNISFVKNKVTALANNNADLIDTYNITRVGGSIGEFYGYQSVGVNSANGNPLWKKANGTIIQSTPENSGYATYNAANPGDVSTSASLTSADKRVLGNSNPTWYGGFNNTFRYQSFDLGIMMSFAGGNKIYNFTRQEALNNQKFQNAGVELLQRWTTPGQVTSVPRLYADADAVLLETGNTNSRFLEDGKFLRAQNISLGYTVDPKLLKGVKINSLRFYFQVQNAFVITGYKGLDPELSTSYSGTTANASANRAPGVDYNTNPVPRTFTLGLNVGF